MISIFKKRVCRNHHVCHRSQSHSSDSDSGILSDADPEHSAPGVPGRPGESGVWVHVLRSRRTCATRARAHRWPWISVLFTQLTHGWSIDPSTGDIEGIAEAGEIGSIHVYATTEAGIVNTTVSFEVAPRFTRSLALKVVQDVTSVSCVPAILFYLVGPSNHVTH